MSNKKSAAAKVPEMDETPVIEVYPIEDGWTWIILTTTTRGVLRFGETCEDEAAAHEFALLALDEL